ncbi:MAG: ATP-binding cassette domain-containing protein [Deltaproteobacteria bacterium]|nr:ATP-binding cassette domain-containing protein [Deltaproteobacteria bacterium]
MTAARTWWKVWAPYWEHLERRHLTPDVIDALAGAIAGPCLVVGSGQGLVLEHLARGGLEAVGVDLEHGMLVRGRERRGVAGLAADARNLPFVDGRFGTVMVASGVIDYLDDEVTIAAIVRECLRVLAPEGSLFVAFYRLHPTLRRIHERLGVLAHGRYHMGRLFDIHETVKESPFRCMSKIVSWTGRNPVSVFFGFTALGAFMPGMLRSENVVIDRIVARAAEDGLSVRELFASVPAQLPHRDAHAARALFTSIGISPEEPYETDDCLVFRLARTGGGAPEVRDAIIRSEGLVKRFEGANRNAVDGVHIAVRRGTIHGILGPNGAGKSTTVRLLLGLLPADRGVVVLAGGGTLRDRRAQVGYVPQNLALYPKLTARENLTFFGRLYRLEARRLAGRIDTLLGLMGLADRADDAVGTFSAGMMRRLNLAAGLLHEPAVLFLDEPTAGIDPQSRHRIYGVVEDLRRAGVTILLTTHHMEEASRLCDRLSIMDRGRIVLSGSPRQLVEEHGSHRLEFSVPVAPPGFACRITGIAGVKNALLTDGELVVMARGGRGVAQLVGEVTRLASEAGAAVCLRSVREPDLESLFLEVTGNELDREA